MDLYTENILDHHENPRHYGKLEHATISADDKNPLCGDELHFDLQFDEHDTLADIAFQGKGCAISQAAASILAEHAVGKTKKQLEEMTKEEILAMIGVPLSVARVKCGLLGFYVVKKALTLNKLSN
jgi:nitrogen fixation NifU-like protein